MRHNHPAQDLIDYLNDRPQSTRRPHRLPAEAYAQSECIYYFTLCARQHGDLFLHGGLARSVVSSLLWRRERHRWKLYAYCLMPDHLHFLLQLTGDDSRLLDGGSRGLVPASVLDQIGDFKKYTTTQVWWKLGGEGRLWQKSSYDRIIRWGDSIDDAARYTLENPVRKGLVEDWLEYPYSGIVDPWWDEETYQDPRG